MSMELSLNQLNMFDVCTGVFNKNFTKGFYKVYYCDTQKFVYRFVIEDETHQDYVTLSEFLMYILSRYQNEIDGDRKIIQVVKS